MFERTKSMNSFIRLICTYTVYGLGAQLSEHWSVISTFPVISLLNNPTHRKVQRLLLPSSQMFVRRRWLVSISLTNSNSEKPNWQNGLLTGTQTIADGKLFNTLNAGCCHVSHLYNSKHRLQRLKADGGYTTSRAEADMAVLWGHRTGGCWTL